MKFDLALLTIISITLPRKARKSKVTRIETQMVICDRLTWNTKRENSVKMSKKRKAACSKARARTEIGK